MEPSRTRRRAGFSLVELLIVMVMLGIVGGLVVTTVARQQRFYRGASEIMDVRSQMRSAVDILSAELRGISAAGGDIYTGTMTSTDVEFRSNFGSAIACRIIPANNQIYIPPNTTLAAGSHTSPRDRWSATACSCSTRGRVISAATMSGSCGP
jgi:prepilin-type N-terminal cleavage/methylation domain-containing protein